jgi:hypothetical protein
MWKQGERAKKQKMAREEEEGEEEWDETIIFGLVELHRERGAQSQTICVGAVHAHGVLSGVPEAQIRPEAMTVAYLSYLPCAFMRSIAGFPKEGKGYFLPHTQEVPGEALCSNVWPEADKLVERMESHPDKADNDMQLDLGSGFPRLLRDSGPRA